MKLGLNKANRTLALLLSVLLLALGAAGARGQGKAEGEGKVYDINEKGEPVAATTRTLAASTAESGVSSPTLHMLRTLEAFNKDVKTVHATFQQVRVDEVMQDVVKSPGELWFDKPARFRSDYSAPQRLVTLIADDTLYMYLPEENQVEYYKFASAEERDQQLHHLLIVFGFNADELVRQYEIRSSEDNPELQAELAKEKLSRDKKVIFAVKPRPAYEESSPFKEMKVTVDKASHLPEKIWYKDLSDTNLTLNEMKVELDPKLPPDVFDKDKLFPKGVEFIDKRNAK